MSSLRDAPRVKRCALFVHAALFAAAASPVLAQDKGTQLETITVTAERRSEDIKDVPNSVSAIRGETLDILNSGGQDVRMLVWK